MQIKYTQIGTKFGTVTFKDLIKMEAKIDIIKVNWCGRGETVSATDFSTNNHTKYKLILTINPASFKQKA